MPNQPMFSEEFLKNHLLKNKLPPNIDPGFEKAYYKGVEIGVSNNLLPKLPSSGDWTVIDAYGLIEQSGKSTVESLRMSQAIETPKIFIKSKNLRINSVSKWDVQVPDTGSKTELRYQQRSDINTLTRNKQHFRTNISDLMDATVETEVSNITFPKTENGQIQQKLVSGQLKVKGGERVNAKVRATGFFAGNQEIRLEREINRLLDLNKNKNVTITDKTGNQHIVKFEDVVSAYADKTGYKINRNKISKDNPLENVDVDLKELKRSLNQDPFMVASSVAITPQIKFSGDNIPYYLRDKSINVWQTNRTGSQIRAKIAQGANRALLNVSQSKTLNEANMQYRKFFGHDSMTDPTIWMDRKLNQIIGTTVSSNPKLYKEIMDDNRRKSFLNRNTPEAYNYHKQKSLSRFDESRLLNNQIIFDIESYQNIEGKNYVSPYEISLLNADRNVLEQKFVRQGYTESGEIIENPAFAQANTDAARLRKNKTGYISGESFDTFSEMTDWMNQQTKGKMITGYNIRGYDVPVLKQYGLFDNRTQTTISELLLADKNFNAGNKYLDVYDEAMKYIPMIEQITGKKTKGYKLTDLADFFGIERTGAHIAAKDVELTEQVLNKIKSFLEPLKNEGVIEQVRQLEINNQKIINMNIANANKQPDIARDSQGRPLPFNNSRGVPVETQGYHFRVDTNAGIPGINITTSNVRLRKQFMQENYELFSGKEIETRYGKIHMPEQRVSSANQLRFKDNVLRIAAENGDVDLKTILKHQITKKTSPETLGVLQRFLDISNKEKQLVDLAEMNTDKDIFGHIYSNYLEGNISKTELIDSFDNDNLNDIENLKRKIQQNLIEMRNLKRKSAKEVNEVESYINKIDHNYKNVSALNDVMVLSENNSLVLSEQNKMYDFFEKTIKDKNKSVYEKIDLLEEATNKKSNFLEDEEYFRKIIRNLKDYQEEAENVSGLYADDFLTEKTTKKRSGIKTLFNAKESIHKILNFNNIEEISQQSIGRILSESDYSIDMMESQNEVVWRELQNRYSKIGEEQHLYDTGFYADDLEEESLLKKHTFEYEIDIDDSKELDRYTRTEMFGSEIDEDVIIDRKKRGVSKRKKTDISFDEFVKSNEINILIKEAKESNTEEELYNILKSEELDKSNFGIGSNKEVEKYNPEISYKKRKIKEQIKDHSERRDLSYYQNEKQSYRYHRRKVYELEKQLNNTDFVRSYDDIKKRKAEKERLIEKIKKAKEKYSKTKIDEDDIYGTFDYLEMDESDKQENVRKTRRIKRTISTDKLNIIDYMPKTWAKFAEFMETEIATDGRLPQMFDEKTVGGFGTDLSMVKRNFLKNVITAYTIQQGGSQNIGINQDFDEIFANDKNIIDLAKRVTKRQLQEELTETDDWKEAFFRTEIDYQENTTDVKTSKMTPYNLKSQIDLSGLDLEDVDRTKLETQLRKYINNDQSRIKVMDNGIEIDGKKYTSKQVVSMYKSGEFDKSLTRIFKEEIVNSAIYNARADVLRKAKEGLKNGTYKNLTEGIVNEAANYINDNTYEGKVSLKYAKGINTNNLFEGLSKSEAFALLVSDISENVQPEDLKVESLNAIPDEIDGLELEEMGADGKTIDVPDTSNIPSQERTASSYSEVKGYVDTIARKIMSDEDFTSSEIRTLTHLIGKGTKIGDYEVVDNGEVLRLVNQKTGKEKTMSFKTASGDVRGVLQGVDPNELLEQLSRAMEIQDVEMKDDGMFDLIQYLSGADLKESDSNEIVKRMLTARIALGNANEEQTEFLKEFIKNQFPDNIAEKGSDINAEDYFNEFKERFNLDDLSNKQRKYLDSLTKNVLKDAGVDKINPNYYNISPTQVKDPMPKANDAFNKKTTLGQKASAIIGDLKWSSMLGVGLTAFGISTGLQLSMQYFLNKNEAAERQKMAMNPIEGSEIYSSYFNAPRLAAQGYLENGYDMDDSFAYFKMTSGKM